MTTVRYEGERLYGRARVYAVDEDGTRCRLEHRIVLHSPEGLDWGYAGFGAAELALNLLVDALGEEATCTVCRGRGRFRGQACADCRGLKVSWRVWAAHQPFKWFYVVGLPDRWLLQRAEIVEWFHAPAAGAAAC